MKTLHCMHVIMVVNARYWVL